jgi:DME family drug/metabolite transporter
MGSRLQVLLAALCFGTTGTAQALGPSLEPAAVGAARIAVGAALLVLVAGVSRCGLPRPSNGAEARIVLLCGAFVAVYQLTFFAAVADTGVAVGTVVAIGSAPAFAGVLGRLVNGEPLTARWTAATALACGGVCLLVLGGGGAAGVSATGVGLAALAGLGYASYAVFSKRLMDRGREPEWVMAAVFGTGAILVLPVLVVAPSGGLLTLGGALLALYLGVVTTALAYVLFARGLREIGAGETATLTLAEPLTAALLGIVALGERPAVASVAGGLLVLSGLLVLAVRRAPVRPSVARARPATAAAMRPEL